MYNFENAKDCYDWEIGKHGISVKFGSYGWTFLPQVMIENNYCKTETLENLIKCAGYSGELKDVEKKMKTIKFQSILLTMNYYEYQNYLKSNKL